MRKNCTKFPHIFIIYIASTEVLRCGGEKNQTNLSFKKFHHCLWVCVMLLGTHPLKTCLEVPTLKFTLTSIVCLWCNLFDFDDKLTVRSHSQVILLLDTLRMSLQNGDINLEQTRTHWPVHNYFRSLNFPVLKSSGLWKCLACGSWLCLHLNWCYILCFYSWQ